MTEVKIGITNDFPEGKLKSVKADDKEILIANIKGNILAIGSICTHEECNLSDGEIEGDLVVCSCHLAKFDLKTGKNVEKPITGDEISDEPSYKIRIKDNEVFVSI